MQKTFASYCCECNYLSILNLCSFHLIVDCQLLSVSNASYLGHATAVTTETAVIVWEVSVLCWNPGEQVVKVFITFLFPEPTLCSEVKGHPRSDKVYTQCLTPQGQLRL